jgi:hypothetical protein
MCIICGDLEQTGNKHLQRASALIDDIELSHMLDKAKAQLRTFEKNPDAKEAVSELRKVIFALMGEKFSRIRA